MISINRHKDETELQYIWRICSAKDAGALEKTWDEVADILNAELRDEDEYWTSSAYRKKYQQAKSFYEDVFSKMESQEYADELAENKRELEKERVKLQTEKIEYNRWLREEGRDELIVEKICDAISKLPPLMVPEKLEPKHSNKSYLLAIADAHYGVEFDIKDFYGESINKYSPEIFEDRMNYLFYQIVEKIETLGIEELTIMELGDGIDGMLRLTSQLMKLRYGVIESAIRYAYILSNFVNRLSSYTRIKLYMTMDSNHNQLRLLDGKKNAFPDENVSKIMWVILQETLKSNPNVSLITNPTGMPYAMMSTYCVVGLHGEKKNLKNNLLEMSHIYGVHIDYTISGHMHHEMMTEIGFDSAVLSVGSIIGVDSYGLSLNAVSNASCSMFEFEQGKGRTAEYIFKLN